MLLQDILEKKVLIWGYGIEGKSALKLLIKNGMKNTVFVATSEKISENIDNVVFITEDEIFKYDFQLVIKSSGISNYKKEILDLREHGVYITTIQNIFLAEINEYRKNHDYPKIVGITGTKGKSTASSMLNHILNNVGYKSLLLGNVGISVLDAFDNYYNYDYFIIELSSYQCANLLYNLDYSIILNLYPEHIDWHLNHENYYKDKLNITNFSKNTIINYKDENIKKYFLGKKNNVIYFNKNDNFYLNNDFIYYKNEKIVDINSIDSIIGRHVFENICSILALLKKENIEINNVLNSIKTFKTLEHRLEIFYKNKNTIYVNDSISTIPEATIKALGTFENNSVFLILGGFDRKQDYDKLINYIFANKNIEKIFLLGQTGKYILNILEIKKFTGFFKYFENLENLVEELKNNDLSDKTVILSPASPSYGMFKNFEERGNLFKKLMLK